MHAFTAILFFCFTDMILMKEIQSSKVFHLIKCSTEIKREMIDVSLKEVDTNYTLLNYSPKNNECTSFTSNAACFVERKGKGMFFTLKFNTDNIGGNISYVCVKTMFNLNGKKTFSTFTATITVDDRRVTSDPIKITSNSPDITARSVTRNPIKTSSNSPDITARTVTSDPIKTTSNSPDMTARTVTSDPIKTPSNSPDITNRRVSSDPIKITSNSIDITARSVTSDPIKTSSNSPDITVTSDPIKTTSNSPDITALSVSSDPIKTTSNSPDITVSLATNPIYNNVNPNTEDETTFFTVSIIIIVIIGAVIVVFILVACVVFYRKLKRQRALNINTPAIGGVQSDTEDIKNGQGAQTTIDANSGTDLAVNMELSQINHDGEPFPSQSEDSFQPTAVSGFGSSGIAVVLHPDPHVPECQNPAPARGSYVQHTLESVGEREV